MQGFQKQYLRGLAHASKPLVQVGQAGLTDGVVAAVVQALLDHELIKVRLLAPDDKQAMAAELATRCAAELVGLVGHTVILYKVHPDEPQIRLPSKKGAKGYVSAGQ